MEQSSEVANRESANHLVEEAIARLRACTQLDILGNWQICDLDISASRIDQLYSFPWITPEVNSNNSNNSNDSKPSDRSGNPLPQKITWAKGSQVRWFRQKLIIPTTLDTYSLAGLSLRLALTWWAEMAQVFVDGQLVQEGDLFDAQARVLLREEVIPGDSIEILVRLVSPVHDQGALMRSLCIYELPYTTFQNLPNLQLFDLNFVADQLAVYQQYLTSNQLQQLVEVTNKIKWDLLSDAAQFNLCLIQWYESIYNLGLPQTIQQHKIHLLGHAHLDMAWLWEVAETWQVAQRTFESVINLQKDFPELIFCHSTPALYQWIEQNRPDLFQLIHHKIQQGTWELVGGMWIEPEMNLISGESIARQLLYGQRYFLEKFGQITKIAWLPDTFGFCATLPQFLQLAGIDYFVTQKLDWNDTTKFPYPLFWWESIDGSKVLSLMSNPIGEGIEPIKIAAYGANWQAKTGLDDHLWLTGVGDHGGGPSRDMLETIKRWQLVYSNLTLPSQKFKEHDQINSQHLAFPQLQFTTALDYLEQIKSQENSSELPIWQDELYLEFHRGCYTTHGDQKYFNRYCEGLLYEVELLAAIATLTTGKIYPQTEITALWQKVLFNQFHDILPGTSIAEVFITANQDWQTVITTGKEIWEASWQAIFSNINRPLPPEENAQLIIVLNSLSWQRSEVVSLVLPACISQNLVDAPWDILLSNSVSDRDIIQQTWQTWQILDSNGQVIPSHLSTSSPNTLLFLAENIPSIGFTYFWLIASPASVSLTSKPLITKPILKVTNKLVENTTWQLKNQLLRVLINPRNGDIASIFDLINNREILQAAGGNQLQFWSDVGQYWDAWNIDPNYAQHPLPDAELVSINYLEQGIIRQSIRVVRKFRTSTFIQDYILDRNSPLVKIVTSVDWQESHVLVKAAFPLTIASDTATYEIPYGTINRSTKPTSEAEKAKWEVPALRWADLSNSEYGVSLLNDCKYGYDAQPDQLRLTLLRSSEWPDSNSDRTQHQFTYALYPHLGSYQQAQTIHRGYELNLPLTIRLNSTNKLNSTKIQEKVAPPSHSWLSLRDDKGMGNLIISSLKLAEVSPQSLASASLASESSPQWILRCYETTGDRATFILDNSLGLAVSHKVNLLEMEILNNSSQASLLKSIDSSNNQEESIEIYPHQVASFCLTQSPKLSV